MTERLLVGVAQAVVRNEPRTYVTELVKGLAGMDVKVQVALLRDGVVRGDLEAVADVMLMRDLRARSPLGIAESIARRASTGLAAHIRSSRTAARTDWIVPPDVVHLNGPQAVPLLQYLDATNVPVTTYVHPADMSVDELSPVDRDLLLACTDRFLAADVRTADRLRKVAGIDNRVEVAPRSFDFREPPRLVREPQPARQWVDLPDDRIVVGVPPVPDWMEAPDLTIAVAWELGRRLGHRSPHFFWFGGPFDERRRWPIEHDLERVGLETVHLAQALPDTIHPLDVVDLVMLPSRTSEPVPPEFVAQAIDRFVPITCWSGDPFAHDILGADGVVVDQPDVGAMADFLCRIVEDESELQRRRDGIWRSLTEPIRRVVPLELTTR